VNLIRQCALRKSVARGKEPHHTGHACKTVQRLLLGPDFGRSKHSILDVIAADFKRLGPIDAFHRVAELTVTAPHDLKQPYSHILRLLRTA
jgi:hypothetical protein